MKPKRRFVVKAFMLNQKRHKTRDRPITKNHTEDKEINEWY